MLPRLALRSVLLVTIAKSLLNLAVANRYGWQRDELYYWVAGQHLQGGYVEFPPVTAVLAAVSRAVFGNSLVGMRAFAIASGAGVVLVASLVARELGGDRRAQLVAVIVVAFSPILARSPKCGRACSRSTPEPTPDGHRDVRAISVGQPCAMSTNRE